MMHNAFRCLALSTLVLLPLLLGAEAVPMSPFPKSEGNELMSAVQPFLGPASSSHLSGNVAHTGLSHKHAGGYDAAQLLHGNKAVSGHLPPGPDDSWTPYYTLLASKDGTALDSAFKYEDPSSLVALSGGYMPVPSGAVQGFAPPQGYLEGWDTSATQAVQGRQGITSAAFRRPQEINHGVAGGSGPLPTYANPDTPHTRYQPYTLRNVDRSSYAAGQKSKPFPAASGSSSKSQVPARPTAVGDFHLAFDLDRERASSWEEENGRGSSHVGIYPRPRLEDEEEFLLRKANRLFSDEYIDGLPKKGKKGFCFSSPDLDRWLLRVLNVRERRHLEHVPSDPVIIYKLRKKTILERNLASNALNSWAKRANLAAFENIRFVLNDFDVGHFTFHLRTKTISPDKGQYGFLGYRNDEKDQKVIYFGQLVLVKAMSKVLDKNEEVGEEQDQDLVSVAW